MNGLEHAALAAAIYGNAPEMTFEASDAVIRLAEGTGHLLDGATITHWTRD
ncbi:hypothetical protein [Mycolicibacterium sp. PDY-3]|uniref:hypothetical protein n=1 Tax=Mycolicibacterium sp. PDY-3 TaxID=3376069 RepID=UPI0037AA4FB7